MLLVVKLYVYDLVWYIQLHQFRNCSERYLTIKQKTQPTSFLTAPMPRHNVVQIKK